jgi:hypothetical protein
MSETGMEREDIAMTRTIKGTHHWQRYYSVLLVIYLFLYLFF